MIHHMIPPIYEIVKMIITWRVQQKYNKPPMPALTCISESIRGVLGDGGAALALARGGCGVI